MKTNHLPKKGLLAALLIASYLQLDAQAGVKISPKLFLAGPMTASGLMRDDLRSHGHLPLQEPYTALINYQHVGGGGGETVTDPAVFQTTGENAIVDWVVIELRSPDNVSVPVATHAALLQRDGDVVSTDGGSPVHFESVAPGAYHIVVRHRNHLGVMTAEALSLNNLASEIDFSDLSLAVYGNNAASTLGGKRTLWLGETNKDRKVAMAGPGNDVLALFTLVLFAPGNTAHNSNYMLSGYHLADTNMDGYAVYNGPNNDRSNGLIQMALNSLATNAGIEEQIP